MPTDQDDIIRNIRKDYRHGELDAGAVQADPVIQFSRWMDEAIEAGIEEPTAMTLATSGDSGNPSARMVLLKGFSSLGFVFFTHYESRKGKEIAVNPHVALVFYWKELERQVRIEGKAEKISGKDSDDYFATRPAESRASAIISPQSQVIPDRVALENRMAQLLSLDEKNLARPAHWGGYLVIPSVMEFWQGRPGRLHDRIRYTRLPGDWRIERLAP